MFAAVFWILIWFVVASAYLSTMDRFKWTHLTAFALTLAMGVSIAVVDLGFTDAHNRADRIFKATETNVFVNVAQLLNDNPQGSFSQITLKDPNTVVLLPTTPDSSATVPTFKIPKDAPLDAVDVSGSISKDKKSWCVLITDRTRQGIYNQTGYISGFGQDSSIALGNRATTADICVAGIVYDQNGRRQYYTNRPSYQTSGD